MVEQYRVDSARDSGPGSVRHPDRDFSQRQYLEPWQARPELSRDGIAIAYEKDRRPVCGRLADGHDDAPCPLPRLAKEGLVGRAVTQARRGR
jgi:hypothetical protein